MENKQNLERLLDQYLHSPYKEETIKLIKSGIRLFTNYEKRKKIGQSKF